MTHERARVGKLTPDARQEQGAAPSDAKNKAVSIGLERAGKHRFALGWDGTRMRAVVARIAGAGALAFAQDAAVRAQFAALRPKEKA